METQRESIKRFSKVIYKLLKIAFVLLIVLGSLQAIAWLWSLLSMHTEVISIGNTDVEMPVLFKMGDIKVAFPILWKSGFDFFGSSSVPIVGLCDLLLTVATIIGLGFAKALFKLLRDNGSPFREDVVAALKRLAIALLCLGVLAGVVPLLAAGIVWVLRMIFDYGCMLQNESDTTL